MRFPLLAFRRGAAALVFLGVLSCDTPNEPPPPDPSTQTLVVCPTTQTLSTQAFVGPLGGIVSLAGSAIGIPNGALPSLTLIKLTIPASQFMEVDVRANNLLEFDFLEPVAIRINYSRCTNPDLATAKLRVWQIDPVTKRLIEHMGGVDDKAARTITFTTPHLSAYAVAF